MSIQSSSKKFTKPFYTYTKQNIQSIPYENYSIETIFVFLQHLDMQEPGLVDIIKQCLFLNININKDKDKEPFIYIEDLYMFYFGKKLTIREEFELSNKIINYIYDSNCIYIPKEIFINDRVSSYSKKAYQYIIKHIPLLKKLLLDYYIERDSDISSFKSIVNLTHQQKMIESSKFENKYKIQQKMKDSENYIEIFKHQENTYQKLMTLFTSEITFYEKEIKKIKNKYQEQLYRNTIF